LEVPALPLYEYKCAKCNNRFEKIESFSAPETQKCPKCGGKAERQISAAGIQFKGSGWYVTDYKGKNSDHTSVAKSDDSSSSTSNDSSSSTSGDSKSADSAATSNSKSSDSKSADSKPAAAKSSPEKGTGKKKK
jgi:putative FmdB family regulatory protein